MHLLARCVLKWLLLHFMPFWLRKGFIGTLYFQIVRQTCTPNYRFVKTCKVVGSQDVLGDEMLSVDKNWGEFIGSSLQIIFTFATPKKLDGVQWAPEFKIKPYGPSPLIWITFCQKAVVVGSIMWHCPHEEKTKHSEAQTWVQTMLTSVFTGLSNCIWKHSYFR